MTELLNARITALESQLALAKEENSALRGQITVLQAQLAEHELAVAAAFMEGLVQPHPKRPSEEEKG